jgi:hypothetical protein
MGEGFMKYAVEMGSGVVMHIPGFIKTGSGILRSIRGNSQTHIEHDDLICLLLFFLNNENMPKIFL